MAGARAGADLRPEAIHLSSEPCDAAGLRRQRLVLRAQPLQLSALLRGCAPQRLQLGSLHQHGSPS
jgi:hypothetical protein